MVLKSPCDDCPGSAAVFDVQLSQLSSGNFTALGTPFIAFEFNFEDPDSIQYDEWKTCDFIVSKVAKEEEEAVMNAVLMWWDLDMDGSGKNILSMAPTWFEDNSPVCFNPTIQNQRGGHDPLQFAVLAEKRLTQFAFFEKIRKF